MGHKIIRGFASANNSGIHPEILKAISSANAGHVVAIKKLKEHFGKNIDAYFVLTGNSCERAWA